MTEERAQERAQDCLHEVSLCPCNQSKKPFAITI